MSKRLVQDVAAARHSGGVKPIRANGSREAAGSAPDSLKATLWDVLRERIGSERHAVWFGDVPQVEILPAADGGMVAVLSVGDGRTHEWL